jgi:hypothetical protein
VFPDGYQSVHYEPIRARRGSVRRILISDNPRAQNGPRRNRRDHGPFRRRKYTERHAMLGTILIVLLILFLVGALPTWGHSRNWGYAPSGGLGLVLLIVLILVLTGNV